MVRSVWTVTGLRSSATRGGGGRWGGGGLRQRVQLRDLAEPEGAVRQLGVGDRERGVAHGALAEAHDVQVQGAGAPSHPALAPALGLNGVEVREQLDGLE